MRNVDIADHTRRRAIATRIGRYHADLVASPIQVIAVSFGADAEPSTIGRHAAIVRGLGLVGGTVDQLEGDRFAAVVRYGRLDVVHLEADPSVIRWPQAEEVIVAAWNKMGEPVLKPHWLFYPVGWSLFQSRCSPDPKHSPNQKQEAIDHYSGSRS